MHIECITHKAGKIICAHRSIKLCRNDKSAVNRLDIRKSEPLTQVCVYAVFRLIKAGVRTYNGNTVFNTFINGAFRLNSF